MSDTNEISNIATERVFQGYSEEQEAREDLANDILKLLHLDEVIEGARMKAFAMINDSGFISALLYHASNLVEKRISV